MSKIQTSSSMYGMCLVSSLILNLLFTANWFVGDRWDLGWTRRAAREAEEVATISCSGHGRAYLDGIILDGEQEPICECNTCYGGPDCSQFYPDCFADADSGDPLFLEPFWMQHAASSALVVAGWHRMSYKFDDRSYISQELESRIRKIHATVGNAETQGRYILFGAGSTQLLHAAVHALSLDHNSSSAPAGVVASVPYYALYKYQADYFGSEDFKFQGDAALWKNISDTSANVIEIVTSPNNPDGQLKKPVLQGQNVKVIHDHAYYWPHFTAIPAPANGDVMIFTISKLTGHAGSRFGWAVIKDEAIYQRITYFMSISTIGVSRDSQLRALKLLQVALQGGGKDLFEFGHETMRKRWERLSNIISMSKRFSLQKISPLYCTYFKKIREASPAYAWVKCEREEDKHCHVVLQAGNITGRQGGIFGIEDRYVRLSLLRSQDDFDLLLHKLNQLISEEHRLKSM